MSAIETLKANAAAQRAKISSAPVWVDQEEPAPPAPRTSSARRMQRKRRREHNALLYWKFRLKTGTGRPALIADALQHAPAIVEAARLKAIKQLPDFAAIYPERCGADMGENYERH